MISRLFALLCRFAPLKRLLWRRWYQFLAGRYRIPEWQMMNYGYAPLAGEPLMALEPADEPERYGLQLYHRVTQSVDLAGTQVLEVGCGRGGGAAWVHQARHPAGMMAVDFSAEAIALCQQRYSIPGLTFQTGDAERLAFPDDSFDAVINIESSHCYGSMEGFIKEVHRVLKPGGHLLFADFRDVDKGEALRLQLMSSGLTLIHERNITPQVLAALDADNDRKLALMHQIIPQRLMSSFQDFAAVKGSLVYEEFRTAGMQYWHFVMQKAAK